LDATYFIVDNFYQLLSIVRCSTSTILYNKTIEERTKPLMRCKSLVSARRVIKGIEAMNDRLYFSIDYNAFNLC